MSAPQTNIEKQERRHKGPLIGVGLAVVVAIVGYVVWQSTFEAEQPGPAGVTGTEQAAPQVDPNAGNSTAPAD
ncbi:hypothetical protein [Sedimentitalea arenosa]|jgi:hypothetical protein|uniref:Uncharacterized protein n=1 Tax=Sedimentitalea arenosa TaxID=2798803 RepID=A0A8J7J0C7_9RHOB|nr:hypothetical protein [Arenibacterium arenosum]MBJ6370010.1 hypothetical protein [Arenibacterium arenosum]